MVVMLMKTNDILVKKSLSKVDGVLTCRTSIISFYSNVLSLGEVVLSGNENL